MTPLEFIISAISFSVCFLTLFYCGLALWVIRRFRTSEELRAWCREWRDKPPFDWVSILVSIISYVYQRLAAVFSRKSGDVVKEEDYGDY